MEQMKAIVHTKYGPPDELQLMEVGKPVPGNNELLIKTHATTATTTDCNARNFTFVPKSFMFFARVMFGFKKPKINVMGMIVILFIVFIVPTTIFAQDDVTIGKYRKFESVILGGEVTYLVHLPEGYENSKKNYPVIYMMNGQSLSTFANATSTLDDLMNERIPDMILVGISNTGVAGQYWSCPDDSGCVKGGDTFNRFLKEDLVPEIEKSYRTNEYKILFGQSNAGLFVLYNLFSKTNIFDAYFVASPMFGWCPKYFTELTGLFLKNNPSLKKKLYVSYGDLDYVEVLMYISDFKDVIKQPHPLFQWRIDKIENAGHVPAVTLNNALLFSFSECTMTPEMKKLSIPEIISHFENLSRDYGFIVNPKAGVLFDMAMDWKNMKEFDRAIDLFNYMISLYPGNELYHYYLGLTYRQKGNIEQARSSFNEALKINADFNDAKIALDKLNLIK
jgi:predicted alpha/beta superfamily hydrolase